MSNLTSSRFQHQTFVTRDGRVATQPTLVSYLKGDTVAYLVWNPVRAYAILSLSVIALSKLLIFYE